MSRPERLDIDPRDCEARPFDGLDGASDRVAQRFGFTLEGAKMDPVRRAERGIVATGLIEKIGQRDSELVGALKGELKVINSRRYLVHD